MFDVVASIDGHLSESVLVVVGHPDSCTVSFKFAIPCPWAFLAAMYSGECAGNVSRAIGVGHPVEPVTDVRSTDARRRKRDRPDPVSQAFQVILYKVDPRICVAARNLLSKDRCRAALIDEVEEVRP
jgi:hypothetical protein